MTRDQYRKLMAKAVATNAKRDDDERKAGILPASECPPDAIIRTAQEALECGLLTQDWNAVAEAAAMLAEITKYFPWMHHEGAT